MNLVTWQTVYWCQGWGRPATAVIHPRTKATPIQYVPCFPFTLLYILQVQYNMESWFTLSHLPVQGEVSNNGKNYSKLYRSWDHSEVCRLCTIIPWDANITAWSSKIAHWFQFPLQRREPRCGRESDNILCNYSPISVTGHSSVFCHILSLISADMLRNSCE